MTAMMPVGGRSFGGPAVPRGLFSTFSETQPQLPAQGQPTQPVWTFPEAKPERAWPRRPHAKRPLASAALVSTMSATEVAAFNDAEMPKILAYRERLMAAAAENEALDAGADADELGSGAEETGEIVSDGVSLAPGGKEVQEAPQDWSPGDPLPITVALMAPLEPYAILFAGDISLLAGSASLAALKGAQASAAVRELRRIATKVLLYDIFETLERPHEDVATDLEFVQPALFIIGVVGIIKLRNEQPDIAMRASAVAGYAVGELCALCAAGVLSFEDGLRLAKVRSTALKKAALKTEGGLLSVVGMDQKKLDRDCKDVSELLEGEVCQIAIANTPTGFTVGGSLRVIPKLAHRVKQHGAQRTAEIPSKAAFGTALMAPARAEYEAALNEVLPRMQPPACTVWMNSSGKAVEAGTDPKRFIPLLVAQLTDTLQWYQVIKGLAAAGIIEFYEIGPGKHLKNMMRKIIDESWEQATKTVVVV